ncbi:DHA2 family efflux MFS transporter permease subunit [Streptomyces coffeae]|uniref:DHA2 family efflux MFS transporter permease subunit n=1 Tax=Streptomyces coffeae TaxID=621382 RepID=A0ABS1ND21_9ACTN|nr:DHA2 family efflux MFS transporter permease subunit [Streptomyces coffeae]MBL1097852.1 DHA2 family efflux MFS transporter permease subunit [Streptomyces coffeae]
MSKSEEVVLARPPAEGGHEGGAAQGASTSLFALGSTLSLGAVLALLSTTLVSVGMGVLAQEFSAGLPTVQWVSTANLLALAVTIPVAGWAMDRFGEKSLWQASLAVYLVGCVAAGLAPTVGVLITARVVQGIGAAMFEPIMLAMLARAAGPGRVTRVMSLVQIPITMAPVFGPVVGGALLDQFDWRWLFWCNVPAGLLCAALAHRLLPRDAPRASSRDRSLDVAGLVLLSGGLAALMLGLSQAASTGEGAAGRTASTAAHLVVPLSLACGVLLLAAYAVHALRTRKVPLLDLRLFAAGRFPVCVLAAFLFGASVYGAMFLLPLFFQQAGEFDAWTSGLLLAPQGLGTVLVLPVVGRLTARFGPRAVVFSGMAVAGLGTVSYTWCDAREDLPLLVVTLLIRGVGLGVTLAPALATGFAGVAPESVGRASSIMIAAIQLGGSVGTALLAVVLQQQLSVHPTVDDAFGFAFWWTLGLCALGTVTALFLPRHSLD